MYHKRCHHSGQLPLLGGSFVILGKFPLIQCRAGPAAWTQLLNSLCWPWRTESVVLLDFSGHQHSLENVGGWSQGWETGDEDWAELQCVPDSSSSTQRHEHLSIPLMDTRPDCIIFIATSPGLSLYIVPNCYFCCCSKLKSIMLKEKIRECNCKGGEAKWGQR